jgi:hypothetical protein
MSRTHHAQPALKARAADMAARLLRDELDNVMDDLMLALQSRAKRLRQR